MDNGATVPLKRAFTVAYAFEAKGIQEYILDRTRMREMVGASGLIDRLSEAIIDEALITLGIPASDVAFCRKGGGGFTLLFSDIQKAGHLRDLISLVVHQHAPGLPYAHAIETGADPYEAVSKALTRLQQAASEPPLDFPLATPLTQRAPRTGQAAVMLRHGEAIDRSARTKQDYARTGDALGQKFDPGSVGQWPKDMNPAQAAGDVESEPDAVNFPFLDGKTFVGILHVDGNGFGQALETLRNQIKGRKDYPEIEYAFSRMIEAIGCLAARQATAAVLAPCLVNGVYPARPLILGGDDLTVILRADVALEFTQTFIEKFEAESRDALARFTMQHGVEGMPAQFTACAGLAYTHAKYPFKHAYQLAENLCGESKRVAKAGSKPPASALSFLRTTSRRDHRFTTAQGDLLEGATYCLGDLAVPEIPALADLCALQRHIAQFSARGAFRELHALMDSGNGAGDRYARWRVVMKRRSPATLDSFDTALARLGTPREGLPILSCGSQSFSPIGDVLTLLAMEGEKV